MFVLNCVDGCMPSDLATGSSRRDRGGAPAALCRDDPGEGRAGADRPQRFYRPRPAEERRPQRIRGPNALHPPAAAEALRAPDLAGRLRAAPPRRWTAPAWTWPPGCGRCGGERSGPRRGASDARTDGGTVRHFQSRRCDQGAWRPCARLRSAQYWHVRDALQDVPNGGSNERLRPAVMIRSATIDFDVSAPAVA